VIAKGHRAAGATSNMDLFTTICEIVNIAPDPESPSVSLWPALCGRAMPADRVVFSQRARQSGHHVAATDGVHRLHAIFDSTLDQEHASFRQYNIMQDPLEQRELLAEGGTIRDGLLDDMVGQWTRSRRRDAALVHGASPARIVPGEKELNRIRSLGYGAAQEAAQAGDRASD
jgi:hypothetical protein